MKDQQTPDTEHIRSIEKATAALSVNTKGYEVQWLPTTIKYRVVALKGRYWKAEVTEISAKEYFEGTGLKTEERQ